MKGQVLILVSICVAVFTVSCERKLRPPDMVGASDGTGSTGLVGQWKFISAGGTTFTSSEIEILGDKQRTESTLTYTSSNPKGFYTITASEFQGNGIGYDFNGTVSIKFFENNILQTSIDNPFPLSTIPPSNPVSKYRLIGADSIYFEGGGPSVQNPGGSATVPSGCKYKIEGKTLTMRMRFSTNSTSNLGGITSIDKQSADVNIVMERQ